MDENLEEKAGFEELLTKNDIKITPLFAFWFLAAAKICFIPLFYKLEMSKNSSFMYKTKNVL